MTKRMGEMGGAFRQPYIRRTKEGTDEGGGEVLVRPGGGVLGGEKARGGGGGEGEGSTAKETQGQKIL